MRALEEGALLLRQVAARSAERESNENATVLRDPYRSGLRSAAERAGWVDTIDTPYEIAQEITRSVMLCRSTMRPGRIGQ